MNGAADCEVWCSMVVARHIVVSATSLVTSSPAEAGFPRIRTDTVPRFGRTKRDKGA